VRHAKIGLFGAGVLTTLLLSTPSALAATQALPSSIYVSNAGSNLQGSGSSQHPYRTIGYALLHAPKGSSVVLMPGTYKESPIIAQSVTLTGENGEAAQTVIDAAGYNNGILISGPGASGTHITDVTVENANNQGILGVDASNLTISGDIITDNAAAISPQIYQDKAITLMGSSNSIIIHNMITHNASGAIALTDDGFFSPGLAHPESYHPELVSKLKLRM
jgi:hypothetical protein